jgi:hypothetical protein
VGGSVRSGSNDLTRAVLPLGMVEDPHDAEREILHCAERTHQRLP